jgi:hypothetical protein
MVARVLRVVELQDKVMQEAVLALMFRHIQEVAEVVQELLA